jgi:hypothetical protein
MSQFIDPERELLAKTFRRGGPMDTQKLRFICQTCGKRITISLRQASKGVRPACSKCGANANIIPLKDLNQVREKGDTNT